MTHYQISRNGQMYGPYTLDDLQRYLASGNVLPTYLAKSDDMAEWVPVSQLLGGQQPSAAPVFSNPGYADPATPDAGFSSPGYANPAYAAAQPALNANQYPDAPNLNWGLVLLIDIFTCGLFQLIWNILVAVWLKKVQPNAKSLIWYILVVVVSVVYVVISVPMQIRAVHMATASGIPYHSSPLRTGFISLAIFIIKLIARFVQRASLEEHFNTVENVGLRLNPVMTFFFGGLYFQYHLNKINNYKMALRMGQPPAGY